ncbi:MAG: ATP-binding cassette domain-containing protein [Planctomycetota bacterium]
MLSPNSPNPSDSSAENRPHFELIGAGRRYDSVEALRPLSLSIGRGENVALIGPSGAGKTTLLGLLNATVRPTTGTVRVAGQDLFSLPSRDVRRRRSRIGIVAQQPSLVPSLRVSQNVLAGRLGRRSFAGALRTMFFPPRPELEAAHEILERVGIPEKLFERTDRLSGGQQQRVAIARALFQEPEAILADEPVSAVDPARAVDTIHLLTQLSRERGITLVASLHDFRLAAAFFPRMIGMRGGRVVFDGAPDELSETAYERLYDLSPAETSGDG